jgi:KRAB domain-containing zinc finger protein
VSQGNSSKQPKVYDMLTTPANANMVSQAKIDDLLIGFITEGLMPFSTVEMPSFPRLVKGLQPNRSVMCRATVTKRIDEKASLVKKNVKDAMAKVQQVATTTDCWTARRRSYIGVTAHWIDSETLDRVSAALACRRLKGRHTYDVLAAKLEEIHTEYEIVSKIVKTTTDNGSNFVKAFSVFAVNPEEPEETEGDESTFHDVYGDLTEAAESFEYQLPPHQRCAAHTLNLISKVDAEKAEKDPTYKRLTRGTFAKCQALWNKASRSTQAAELVQEECSFVLLKPNATRWNSVFMAVERLNHIAKTKGENAIHKLCAEFNVSK